MKPNEPVVTWKEKIQCMINAVNKEVSHKKQNMEEGREEMNSQTH